MISEILGALISMAQAREKELEEFKGTAFEMSEARGYLAGLETAIETINLILKEYADDEGSTKSDGGAIDEKADSVADELENDSGIDEGGNRPGNTEAHNS